MGVETPYELPLWIIISAVVAGIVLLGIIILILWKVRLQMCSDRTLVLEHVVLVADCSCESLNMNHSFTHLFWVM